jgi:transcription elongation factor Elf1
MATLTTTFTCPKCKAVYECQYQEYLAEQRTEFRCENCDTTVHSWKGGRDYTDFKMVKKPDRA